MEQRCHEVSCACVAWARPLGSRVREQEGAAKTQGLLVDEDYLPGKGSLPFLWSRRLSLTTIRQAFKLTAPVNRQVHKVNAQGKEEHTFTNA